MPDDPDAYPYSLEWSGNHIFLVIRPPSGEEPERRDLGTSSPMQVAYQRWKHLRTDHSKGEAAMFLWGFLTGLQASLMAEIDALINRADPR
jgi:hypothetical protein